MQNTRGHILWVDDEIQHLKPHILFLEEKGYTLSQATNGQDAIALSEKNNYDLILLDQSMPGMDGLQTLAELKNSRSSQQKQRTNGLWMKPLQGRWNNF